MIAIPTGRSIFIWKLGRVLARERSVSSLVAKAKSARVSSIWIKIADGQRRNASVQRLAPQLIELVSTAASSGISIFGWHVVKAANPGTAVSEAQLVGQLVHQFALAGAVIDAESGSSYFKGSRAEARLFMQTVRQLLHKAGKPVGLTSHDIPNNFPTFPFAAFAEKADFLAPQVYYGTSRSVQDRISRALTANRPYNKPIIPIGAGWVTENGTDGGCRSEQQSLLRASQFITLAAQQRLPGYGFWVWDKLSASVWDLLGRTN